MSGRKNGRGYDFVLLDVNTQRDFCALDGSCPVTNLRELVQGLRITIAWARRNHVPVVSSIESHRPFELSDSGTPIYCVDGSNGQHKLGFTLFPLRTKIEVDNTLALPIDLFDNHQQVIFRKRTDDLLMNPKADRLLSQLPTDEFAVCGTGLETSIKAAALALLARGKKVSIVVDACGYWNRSAADLALRQVAAKGAVLITVSSLRERRCEHTGMYPFMHRNGATPSERTVNDLASPNGNGNGKPATLSTSNGKAQISSNGSSNGKSNGHMNPPESKSNPTSNGSRPRSK